MANPSSFSSQKFEKLPKETCWESFDLYKFQGFWYPGFLMSGVLGAQSHFEARSDDVILASFPKTGTTWLKALCHCILQEHDHDLDDQLSLRNPHALVRTLEIDLFKDDVTLPDIDLSIMPSPRLFHTHMAYSQLKDSVLKNLDCKIVYITRNPKDVFVSSWHFFNGDSWRTSPEPYPIEKVFDEFCKGHQFCGPFYDHVLEFWFESLKMPEKILFLKYEEMKRDPKGELKKLAAFLGRPFSNDEEVEKVLWRSSFDRLKNLEVNKNGVVFDLELSNKSFFRRGVVGDWKNHFTAEMKKKLDEISCMKLEGSGLDFET
ncbi:hypothetical protein Ddye_029350 [Dipteronia dyeriana]|uniref:Sulfotransferase n=1 Tax=Dipteronia dyeriana TaxID=168575 RepID=A0AAD9TEZ2_9ROSI|nr:hypothetical protein Ddye_029350 [Dipteronia dyeriana]